MMRIIIAIKIRRIEPLSTTATTALQLLLQGMPINMVNNLYLKEKPPSGGHERTYEPLSLCSNYSPVLFISCKLLPHGFQSLVRHHSEELIQLYCVLRGRAVNLVFISLGQLFDQLDSL